VSGDVHTNGIENYWSLLERSLKGRQIHVSPDHLHRYVTDPTFAYNNRGTDDLGPDASRDSGSERAPPGHEPPAGQPPARRTWSGDGQRDPLEQPLQRQLSRVRCCSAPASASTSPTKSEGMTSASTRCRPGPSADPKNPCHQRLPRLA